MQFSCNSPSAILYSVIWFLVSLQTVMGESICFENMDQLFKSDSSPKDPDYYRSNIKAPKAYPHIVSIRSRNAAKCVGVIISKRYILSSAVCLKSSGHQPVTAVWTGDVPTKNATEEYRRLNTLRIEELVIHPEYTEHTFFRNIGLIRLAKDMEFTSRRFPACLDVDWDGEESRRREKKLILSSYNRDQADVPVTSFDTCNEYFDMLDILDTEQFCGAVRENCYFDSGSALQRPHEGMEKVYSVLGVISLRKDCKIGESQVVFTKIAHFVKWIESVLVVVVGVGNVTVSSVTRTNGIS